MTGPHVAIISSLARRTRRAEEGQGLAEYVLATGLVAVVAIFGVTFLGQALDVFYRSLSLMVGG